MSPPLPALPDRKVATVIRNLAAEIDRLEAVIALRSADAMRATKAEAEIFEACGRVARAADRLAQARFSGTPEREAGRALESAARELARVMKRHGRMPAPQ